MSEKLKKLKKLTDLGFSIVRVNAKSKVPAEKGWPTTIYGPDDFAPDDNVAVLLGDKFVDVDLDADVARRLAPYILPKTNCIWGRQSSRQSHYLYRVAGANHVTFSNPQHGMLVEQRTGKHLTLAPGSLHPSGEAVTFDNDGPPSEVDAVDLERRVRCLTAAVLVALEAWGPGVHHDASLGFAGVCAKAGLPIDLVMRVMEGLKEIDPSADIKQLRANVKTTYAQYKNGKSVAGIAKLRNAGLSTGSAKALWLWLNPDGDDTGHDAEGMGMPLPPNWPAYVTTCRKFRKRDIPPKEALIEGVLCATDIALLYGEPGCGKTLISLAMGHALASGTSFAGNNVPKPRRVLFIDGELGAADLQALIINMDIHDDVYLIASIDLDNDGVQADIADAGQQAVLIEMIDKLSIDVVIFDNLFSLAMIKEFISNDDPGIVSLGKFGSVLRNRGVSVLFVHHGTKTGIGPAGASRLTVHVDLVMSVKKVDDGITIRYEKSRGRPKPDPVHLTVVSDETSLKLIEGAPHSPEINKHFREVDVLRVLKNGPLALGAIAKKVGVSKTTVHDVVGTLITKGYVSRKNKSGPTFITKDGEAHLVKVSPVDKL